MVSDKNGRSRKLFSRSLAMSTPSASTVTQPRSAAAKAARGRGRASLRHRPASSSSSPRSTTSCAPCRTTTTMRTRAVARPQLHVSSQRISQTNKCTPSLSLSAPICLGYALAAHMKLWTCHNAPPHTASSQTVTRTRCQRRASSALVAETAVRTLGVIDVLGRVPSGSREGRVPSACITFFRSCH